MKTFISVAAFLAGALAQSTFEPADFNVTEALLGNGVDISTIPELAELAVELQERSLISGCSIACNSLKLIFGDDQVETQSETAYSEFVNSFWSGQQRAIAPECVFKPEKALDVSTAILISRLTQCPFAAKSGGHSAVPGGSNIDGGISISFEKLDDISVSSDKKIVSFQPGHTWFDIYTFLEKYGLAVNGGRVSTVGVGGLTLGGGISYTSSVYGMACDNVVSYELVTASGIIINVSETKYADLYWALRGGGNNFGIVTKFSVESIPLGQMWGGMRTYLEAAFPSLFNAFYNLGKNSAQDGKAHQILSFGWRAPNLKIANAELEYAEPIANASILAEYNALTFPTIRDTIAVRSLGELTSLLETGAGKPGLRQAFWTWSTKLDKEMAVIAKDIFYEELPAIVDVADVLPAMSLQVLTEPILEKMKKRGGNALGLSAADGPIMNGLLALKWSNPADDAKMNGFAARVKDRVVAAAQAKGKAHPYLYMNYASPWQDPIASYGSTNKARLINIANKYDPTQVFQKLQPGYFKLDGSPLSGSP